MLKEKSISQEDWEEKYVPVVNHLDDNASWQNEYGVGIMFETYGEEVEHVFEQDHHYVWTYIDSEDGGTAIIAGRSIVNRIGYFITEIPWEDEDEFLLVKVSE